MSKTTESDVETAKNIQATQDEDELREAAGEAPEREDLPDNPIEAANDVQATRAEGELRKAAGEALKRASLPDDLMERTKTLPGALSEHAAAFATLPDADRLNLRKAFRDFAKFPVAEFDKLTGRSSDASDGKQGQALVFGEPEPWPDSVDGAALLAEIATFIRRHVWIGEPEADALVLWLVTTWIHDRLELSTFANLTSATKRCGKSLLIELLIELAYRAMSVSGQITPAALFRVVEAERPTLMLDEADTYMRDDEVLRGVVNGSQRRKSAYIVRCVEPDYEPRTFSTWCPKLIAGIGKIPDTILDRSLVVRLERKPPQAILDPWRERDREAIEAMRRRLSRWTVDNVARIVTSLPAVEFPAGLHDRARDAWESLLAIANAAGGEWSGCDGRAWRAAEHFATAGGSDEDGAREMLLADLYAIFETDGMPSVLSSTTIVERLHGMEGQPWKEWRRGKSITVHALARLLKPFGIAPRQDRKAGDGANLRGYQRADLERVWEAYLPGRGGNQSATSLQPLEIRDFRESRTATGDFGVAVANIAKPLETKDCSDVAVRNPGSGETGAEVSPELPKQPPSAATLGDAYRRVRDEE